MTETSAASLAHARSFLFVPANRPERFAKALASGADAVIMDLEDAVAPADKATARQTLPQAVTALDPAQCRRLLVRVNAAGTPWHADDLAAMRALVAHGLGSLMVPKADSTAALAAVAAADRVGGHGQCLDGRMVDGPVLLLARRTLAQGPQGLEARRAQGLSGCGVGPGCVKMTRWPRGYE